MVVEVSDWGQLELWVESDVDGWLWEIISLCACVLLLVGFKSGCGVHG